MKELYPMQTNVRLPTGIRIIEIILGGIAIALAFTVLLYPGLGIGVLIFLLSITLLVVGFERIAMAFAKILPKSVRVGNVVLGALAITAGIAVIAFPLLAIGLLVGILSFGLLFIGVARIIHGIKSKNISKWSRIFILGVGILSIIIAATIITSPLLGVFLLTFILGVNLLIIGIESISYAVRGHISNTIPPTDRKTDQ
jgi:uncharacterized membrane protein HdeD (DUF308 family)